MKASVKRHVFFFPLLELSGMLTFLLVALQLFGWKMYCISELLFFGIMFLLLFGLYSSVTGITIFYVFLSTVLVSNEVNKFLFNFLSSEFSETPWKTSKFLF